MLLTLFNETNRPQTVWVAGKNQCVINGGTSIDLNTSGANIEIRLFLNGISFVAVPDEDVMLTLDRQEALTGLAIIGEELS